MGPLTSPSARHRTIAVVGSLAVALLLLVAAPARSADSVATIATRLAADTKRLAEARDELADVRVEQRRVRREHRVLRRQVELRLVAIYKSGGASEPISNMAVAGDVRRIGRSLDTLDVLARHESRKVARFTVLGKRAKALARSRTKLEATVVDASRDVQLARVQLSRAEAAAAAQRRAAARMANIADSPVLPRIGHPENSALGAAGAPGPVAHGPIGFRQTGVASMYSDSFTGELTANGERYDPGAFTAAHPSLPFGTWVNVSGPGGSVAVRINDRGPFVAGRVIDLSRAAANAIRLPGIATVNLTVSA